MGEKKAKAKWQWKNKAKLQVANSWNKWKLKHIWWKQLKTCLNFKLEPRQFWIWGPGNRTMSSLAQVHSSSAVGWQNSFAVSPVQRVASPPVPQFSTEPMKHPSCLWYPSRLENVGCKRSKNGIIMHLLTPEHITMTAMTHPNIVISNLGNQVSL